MEERKPIGESDFGTNDGVSFATHQISIWLDMDVLLQARAREIIAEDKRDETDRFPLWVRFLLYGSPEGDFNLSTEPKHDGLTVRDIKDRISFDDFRRVDWDEVRHQVTE